MAVGDLWVRTGNFFAHYDSAGTEILIANIPTTPYLQDFSNPPNMVHDGESLWTLGQFSVIARLDPSDFSVIELVDVGGQATLGNGYVDGLTVRGSGSAVCWNGATLAFMVLDHSGTKTDEQENLTADTGPYPKRVSAAPGSSTGVYEYEDAYGIENFVVVATVSLADCSYSLVNVDKPGGNVNAGAWFVAGKPDGGFWITWHTDNDSAIFTEHTSSGSTVQTLTMPSTDPYYEEVTGIDVDVDGNLIALLAIYDSAHTPTTSYYQFARFDAGTGDRTDIGPSIPDDTFYAGGNEIYLHVERAFAPDSAPEVWDFDADWYDFDFPDPSWDDDPPAGTTRVRFAKAQVHARAEIQLPLTSPWDIPDLSGPWDDGSPYALGGDFAGIPGDGQRTENWAVFDVPSYIVVRGNAEPVPELFAVSRSTMAIPTGATGSRPAREDITPGLTSRWLPDVGLATDWTADDGRKWLAGTLPLYEAAYTYDVSPVESLTHPMLRFGGGVSIGANSGEHWLKSDPATWDDAAAYTYALVLIPRRGLTSFYSLIESQLLSAPSTLATYGKTVVGLRMNQDTLNVLTPTRAYSKPVLDLLPGRRRPVFVGLSLDNATRQGRLLVLGSTKLSATFTLPSDTTAVSSDLFLGACSLPRNPADPRDARYLASMYLFEALAGPVAYSHAELDALATMLDSVYGITG